MLHVRVLGELEIELDGTRLEAPASRRARSLLGLLALERRAHARSELAARFWPDVLDESARTSLRSALAAVRRSLGPDADSYLVATRDRVGLADDVQTDVEEFSRLVDAGELQAAIDLWRGDLLWGLDDDWVLVARDEWRDRATAVLAELATRAERADDLEIAVGHARRMVAIDPLGEQAQRTLIRTLAAAGNRAAALAAYERYADRLRAELRVAPSRATRALAEELRSGELDGERERVAAVTIEPTPAPPPAAALPSVGTVALLFTDLVGSTQLLDALGDDGFEELRRVHFGLLRDVALSHAGREVKNLGDGLMVAFASTVDAAGCAVGMQRAVDRYNRSGPAQRLSVRVGLHAGEPIHGEGDYFGTAVVVAKRLCDLAHGGQILVSQLVRDLVAGRGDFGFRPLGELALKGFAQPVSACELAWEETERRRVALPPELDQEEGVLVGRDAELKVLQEAWSAVREGHTRVVMVCGDPGIGKTRLVAEVARRAHREGATVLFGRSTEEQLAPYQPFVEALRQYTAARPLEELVVEVGARRDALAALVPDLAGAGGSAPQGDGRGEGDRYALFDGVASLLRDAARDRPIVLVLDDLHWADAPALLLLRHLVRAAADAPLLVLGTYRDVEMHADDPLEAALADFRRARSAAFVPLVGLAADAVGQLIRGHGSRLDDDQIRAVAERTEGNPFFVEEVVRSVESGAELSVPESVKDLVLRRLRRLDEPVRDLLAAGAVVGNEFDLAMLGRVTGVDEDTVLDAMDAALAARAIVEAPDEIGSYTFAHVLIRETIYEQLSATRRARLHARVAEALRERYGAGLDEHAAELAHHFLQSGDDLNTFEYQLLAAENASRVEASEAAIAHYGAALDAATRLGLSPRDDQRVRRLLVERGWRLRYARGDWEAGIADFRRALDGARAAGDRRLEADALDELGYAEKLFDIERSRQRHLEALAIAEEIGDESLQVRVLNRLSLAMSNQLDLAGAVEAGERALALARSTGDATDRALAIDALKLAALQLGELDRVDELAAELEEIQRAQGNLWYLQWTLLEGAFVPLGRSRWDAALARLEDALAVSRRVGDPVARPLIHDAICWLERSRGRYDRALAEGRRAVQLSAPGGSGPWTAWTRATLGWCLLEIRAVDEAISVLDQGLSHAEHRADRFRAAAHLAWAHALAGDLARASDAADQAEEALSNLTLPEGGAYLFGFGATVALARARLATGRGLEAPTALEPLAAAARVADWHEAAATALLATGLCHAEHGPASRAEAALDEALALAREYGLPGVEWEALAALATLRDDDDDAARLRSESAAVAGRLAARVGDEHLATELARAAQS